MKKVLITGVNSYVGNKFAEWMDNYPDDGDIDKVSLRDHFMYCAIVYADDNISHGAGIAAVFIEEQSGLLYHEVKLALTIGDAEKEKEAGMKDSVSMSTIIAYGDGRKKEDIINQNT